MPTGRDTPANAAHTPAPWYVDDHGNVRHQASDAIIAVPQDGGHVTKRLIGVREQKANGYLIAAAPDLAQALRDLLGMHDCMKTVGVLPADYGIIAGRARAALATASGEPT